MQLGQQHASPRTILGKRRLYDQQHPAPPLALERLPVRPPLPCAPRTRRRAHPHTNFSIVYALPLPLPRIVFPGRGCGVHDALLPTRHPGAI